MKSKTTKPAVRYCSPDPGWVTVHFTDGDFLVVADAGPVTVRAFDPEYGLAPAVDVVKARIAIRAAEEARRAVDGMWANLARAHDPASMMREV